MPDVLTITPTELAFVDFVGRESSTSSPLAQLLHIPDVSDPKDPLLEIGFQSLVARDLAQVEADKVDLEPRVAAIGGVIREAERCIAVLLSVPGQTDASRIIEGFGIRALFTPRPPNLQDVSFLNTESELPVMISSIVSTFFAKNAVASAAIVVELDRSGSEHGMAISARDDGQLVYAIHDDEDTRAELLVLDMSQLEEVIAQLLG